MHKKRFTRYLILFFMVPVALSAKRKFTEHFRFLGLGINRCILLVHSDRRIIRNQDGKWIHLRDGTWLHVQTCAIHASPHLDQGSIVRFSSIRRLDRFSWLATEEPTPVPAQPDSVPAQPNSIPHQNYPDPEIVRPHPNCPPKLWHKCEQIPQSTGC
ncbi:MAG: hypothetical protein LBB05_04215 [Puniceicoccales bacterium]|jgi:hypothetical protein|nr:hypothetical protein [Puniceicoccales bacterium]